MIKRTRQKELLFTVLMSTCGLCANGNQNNDLFSNIINRQDQNTPAQKSAQNDPSNNMTSQKPARSIGYFVATDEFSAEQVAQKLEENRELIFVGFHNKNRVYVDQSMVQTVAEYREIPMEDAKQIMLRTIIYLLESKTSKY